MTYYKCEKCNKELTKSTQLVVLDKGYFVCLCAECRQKRLEEHKKERGY